jgi:hypothetical protein
MAATCNVSNTVTAIAIVCADAVLSFRVSLGLSTWACISLLLRAHYYTVYVLQDAGCFNVPIDAFPMLFQHITPFRTQCAARLVAPLSIGRTELANSSSSMNSSSSSTSGISSPKHRTSHLHHSTSSLATSTRPGASLGAISEARSGTTAHLTVNTASAAAAAIAAIGGSSTSRLSDNGALTARSTFSVTPGSPTAATAAPKRSSSGRQSSISVARHSTVGCKGLRQTVMLRSSGTAAAGAGATELDDTVDFNTEYLMTGTKAKVKLVLTVVSSSHAGSTGGMGGSTVANGNSNSSNSSSATNTSGNSSGSTSSAAGAAAGGALSSCRPTFVGQAVVEVNKDLLYHKHRVYTAVLASTAAVRLRRLQGEIKAGKQSPLIELDEAPLLPQQLQDKLKLTVKLTPCSNIQSRCGYLEVRAVQLLLLQCVHNNML